MTYPVMDQDYNSDEVRLNGRQLDRASNGAPRIRQFFTTEKKTFRIVHPNITAAEKATFEAFYTANLLNSFAFVWDADGVSYTVYFGEKDPVYKPIEGGTWTLTVELVQA